MFILRAATTIKIGHLFALRDYRDLIFKKYNLKDIMCFILIYSGTLTRVTVNFRVVKRGKDV